MNAKSALQAVVRSARGAAPTFLRDGVGVTGLGLIAYGAHEIYHPAGWIVLGLELVGAVFLTTRVTQPESKDQAT